MFYIDDSRRTEDQAFPLTVQIPQWTSDKTIGVILSTVSGVVAGCRELPPGIRDLIDWVGVSRGSWECGKELGDVVVTIKILFQGNKIELSPLRTTNHSQGIEKRVEGLFKAHVINDVQRVAMGFKDKRDELVARAKS